jgi:hypothetical protein
VHVLGEAARAVVQRHAVQVSDANHCLEEVACALLAGVVARYQDGGEEGEGAPG